MQNFSYYAPTKILFGPGTENLVAEQVKAFNGTKVLLHYGSGSVIHSGLLQKIRQSLDAAGIPYVLLGGVVPNPRLSLVYQGISLAKKENVDFILAVGGGSTIDSAKAIGYGVACGGDVWDLFTKKKAVSGCLPIGVILTLAATGSEMSSSCVITNEATKAKLGCKSDFARPKFAILNPDLTLTLPAYQTSCGCADICMHTMERYFTGSSTMQLTDTLSESLLRTVMQNSLILMEDPCNASARAEIMWAGSLSHNGLMSCGSDGGDWITHKLEHEISGMFDVAHGAGLTAIWGSWARYVCESCLPRFVRFASNVLNIPDTGSPLEVALQGIAQMETFFRALHLPTCFSELGIDPTEEEMTEMARRCALVTGEPAGSVKKLTKDDYLTIYRMAKFSRK